MASTAGSGRWTLSNFCHLVRWLLKINPLSPFSCPGCIVLGKLPILVQGSRYLINPEFVRKIRFVQTREVRPYRSLDHRLVTVRIFIKHVAPRKGSKLRERPEELIGFDVEPRETDLGRDGSFVAHPLRSLWGLCRYILVLMIRMRRFFPQKIASENKRTG